MMNLILVLISISFIQLDFVEVEKKIAEIDKYSELINLIDKEIGYTDYGGNKISHTIERELGNDTQQIRFGFITEEYGVYYHLSLVKRVDELLYCELKQGSKKSKILFSEEGIMEYLDYFNFNLQTSKNINDFTSEIDDLWMFSNGCGFSGEPTADWKKIEKFVEKNNIAKVRNYLYSLDVESQIYGIIGMNKLSNNGVKLLDKDKKAIEFLKERNSKVYTCMGCLMGEIIETKELVEYWEN